MKPLILPLLTFFGLAVIGCGPEYVPPDGEWNVNVTRIDDTCGYEGAEFSEDYIYQLYYEGSATEVRIYDVPFATGMTSGCNLSYQSAVWVENRSDGSMLRWKIVGTAEVQGQAAGCNVTDGHDWYGIETVEITESTDELVPEGCTQTMEVIGTFISANE